MTPFTNRSKPVDRRPMSLMEKIYVPAVVEGLAITFGHIFRRKPTIQFPEKQRVFGTAFRGLHVLNRDEEGRENCTACGLCAVACPAEAITMEAAERQPGEESLYREEKYAARYEINMLRCIFCGLCEEACPKDAIYLTETFTPSDYTRKQFIYTKEDLLIPHPVKEPEAYEKALGNKPKRIKQKDS